MPLYTPGRRRAIVLLLLTSILLLTLDLRGNSLFDAARDGFDAVVEPIENATEVVTRPIENAWYGITNYEHLEEENRRLREQVETQVADQISARAVIIEDQELRRLNNLESLADIPTVVATVVGQSPTNFAQVIEIDRGSEDGIDVGMAVVTAAGLVGKVTAPVSPNRARVMLISDVQYAVDVKIVPSEPVPPTTTTSTTTTSTTLPGQVPVATSTSTSTTTSTTTTSTTTTSTTTTVPGSATETSGAGGAPEVTGSSVPAGAPTSAPVTTQPAPTTTTIDLDVVRETGGFSGQGDGKHQHVTFLDQTPAIGRFEEGDYVFTSGSEDSLAPANIPIGRVVNVVERSTAEGPLLEVEPFADLDRLYFVRVVLYKPASEVPATAPPDEGG